MDNFMAALLCLPFVAGPLVLLGVTVANKLLFYRSGK